MAYKLYNSSGWLHHDINHLSRSPFYELREAIKNNPLVYMDDETELLESVEKGRQILVIQEDEQLSRKAAQHCKLVSMEVCFLDFDKKVSSILESVPGPLEISDVPQKFLALATNKQSNWDGTSLFASVETQVHPVQAIQYLWTNESRTTTFE